VRRFRFTDKIGANRYYTTVHAARDAFHSRP
jgi:hypothetical protein